MSKLKGKVKTVGERTVRETVKSFKMACVGHNPRQP